MARTRAGSGQIQPNLKIQGDQGIIIPVGTTAQRNPSPEPGEVRFNTDLATFEGYTGQIWGGMGPFPFVKSEYFEGDGSTYSFALEQQISNPEDLTVLINGVQLRAGIDFQIVGLRNLVFQEDDGTINPPNPGAEISVRYFVPITSASVIANSISVEELAVVPGNAGQLLSIDANQDLVFTSIIPDSAVGVDQLIYTGNTGVDGQAVLKQGAGFTIGEVSSIAENSIGVRELNVSDGQVGQVLATDGQGNLTFITISGGGSGVGAVGSFFDLSGQIAYNQIPDDIIDIAKLDVTDGTAGQVLSTDGNGTLSFIDVASVTITGSNIGSGQGVFAQKNVNDLEFKSINVGSGLSIVSNDDTITITNSSPNIAQNTFNVITVAGQSSIAADSVSDTLTFVEGNNITITTDPTNDAITIEASGGGLTQNIWETIIADSGTTTANSTTDTLSILGGTDIETSIVNDELTINWTGTAGDPDQNVFVTFAGDVGSTTANTTTDQLNIVGGTDIGTSVSGDTLTINYTGSVVATNSFSTIAVSGQSNVTADTSTDTLTLVAGSNVTITTDPATDAITINAAAGSGGSGTVGLGTVNHLAYYPATGTTISDTGSDLQWDSGNSLLSVVGTVDATIVQGDTIQSTGTGVPTFTSGSDIVFDAASGVGNIDVGGSRIIDVGTPTANTDATSKSYVDTSITTAINNYTPTMSGIITDTRIVLTSTGGPNVNGDIRLETAADGNVIIQTNATANPLQNGVFSVEAGEIVLYSQNGDITLGSAVDANINMTAQGTGYFDIRSGSGNDTVIITTNPGHSGNPWGNGLVIDALNTRIGLVGRLSYNGLNGNGISTSVGVTGDQYGDIGMDENHIYFCTADYDGVTHIWNRLPWAQIGTSWTNTANAASVYQNLFVQVDGDTGTTTADSTADVLTIAGGTDISTAVSGDTVTINYTGTVNPPTLPAITQLAVTPNFSIAYRMDQYGTTDNPTVYAISGTTIAFDLTNVTPSHPFAIEDSGGTQYNDGLVHIAPDGTVSTGSNAQGKIEGVLYWKIPIGTTGNYFYQCTFHSAMRGTITIKDFATL